MDITVHDAFVTMCYALETATDSCKSEELRTFSIKRFPKLGKEYDLNGNLDIAVRSMLKS